VQTCLRAFFERIPHLLYFLAQDEGFLGDWLTSYVAHRASVDFVIYNRVSNRPLLAVEVDGFAFHENNPAQLERDSLKNEVLHTYGMPLLRLPTTGSGEEQRIRTALDQADALWTQLEARGPVP